MTSLGGVMIIKFYLFYYFAFSFIIQMVHYNSFNYKDRQADRQADRRTQIGA